MAESTQHVLSRVRPPRVQITYDVEIGNAIEKKELPFVMGVLADLSGKPETALPLVRDRKFVEIDRDNFNDVLASIEPRLTFRVPNRLKPDANDNLNIELKFKHMDDFGPVEVINQIPALRKLYEGRLRLRDLLTKLDGNDDLANLLNQVIANTGDQEALKQQLAAPADQPAEDKSAEEKPAKGKAAKDKSAEDKPAE
jgi:type VI secretion system protein ImpB